MRRGGAFSRLVEASWSVPLDTGHSARHGGRWNAAGSYGVLYLNASLAVARLQVAHKLAGHPYGIEDLDPLEQHDLVDVQVAEAEFLDCVSEPGLHAVGLPPSYPLDARHRIVEHRVCQRVGAEAYATPLPGIACRSAATGASVGDEELAVFDRAVAALVTESQRRPFVEWYLAGA